MMRNICPKYTHVEVEWRNKLRIIVHQVGFHYKHFQDAWSAKHTVSKVHPRTGHEGDFINPLTPNDL
jgi:hypothetical protein